MCITYVDYQDFNINAAFQVLSPEVKCPSCAPTFLTLYVTSFHAVFSIVGLLGIHPLQMAL